MPTYEYKCNDCGKDFEVFKSIKDESLPVCPECNSNNVSRLISSTNFILKGSGWYITDYGNKHSPPPANASKSPVKTKSPAKSTENKAISEKNTAETKTEKSKTA